MIDCATALPSARLCLLPPCIRKPLVFFRISHDNDRGRVSRTYASRELVNYGRAFIDLRCFDRLSSVSRFSGEWTSNEEIIFSYD